MVACSIECASQKLCPEVIASRKTVFQVRYLRQQFPMGSNRASLRATGTNSRHQVDSIILGMPLVCSRPLIHFRMEGSKLRDMPWIVVCLREIAVTYPLRVFTDSILDLSCKKSITCFTGVLMGF